MTEVTCREAAQILGYTHASLSTMISRHTDRWPSPVGHTRVRGVLTRLYDLEELTAASGRDRGLPAYLPARTGFTNK